MAVFEQTRKVRFAHVDYAGIIFYPRYFEMLNALVEDWFDEALRAGFPTLLDQYDLGAPLVGVETQFLAPCRIGDVLKFELSVSRLGARSVTLKADAKSGGEDRIQSMFTIVCARRDMSGAALWPAEIRRRMEDYLNEAARHA